MQNREPERVSRPGAVAGTGKTSPAGPPAASPLLPQTAFSTYLCLKDTASPPLFQTACLASHSRLGMLRGFPAAGAGAQQPLRTSMPSSPREQHKECPDTQAALGDKDQEPLTHVAQRAPAGLSPDPGPRISRHLWRASQPTTLEATGPGLPLRGQQPPDRHHSSERGMNHQDPARHGRGSLHDRARYKPPPSSCVLRRPRPGPRAFRTLTKGRHVQIPLP